MRLHLKVFPLLVLLPLAISAAEIRQANIILFLVDDMGLMDTSLPMVVGADGKPEAHPLNSWFRTPNIERLARRGIRFSEFYAHTVCSPTRISLMTGQNSARHRTTQFISPNGKNTGEQGPKSWNWKGLTSQDVTLPALLKNVGYRTIHVGKAHFAPPGQEGENPTALGFDVNIAGCSYGQPGSYFGEDGYGNSNPKRRQRAVPGLEKYHKTNTFLTEALTIEAKAEIDRTLEEEKPFFLFMSHYAVHSPFQSDPRFSSYYAEANRKKDVKAFATLIEGIDKSLGDLLDHLEARSIAIETLILFMGDNGTASPVGGGDEIAASAPLRGKKATRWEGGVRVPFIAAWADPVPDHLIQKRLPIKIGAFQTQAGFCYDVVPTLTALTGIEIPFDHVVDGQDMGILFTGEPDPSRQEVFLSHFPHSHTNDYFTTYREGDWKLIYNYFPDPSERRERYALYNLAQDPSESKDLSNTRPVLLKELTEAMVRSLQDMNALYPFADGRVQVPIVPRSKVNR
ncbi:MAG: sulfatase-like hydrolase/transferase [Verrucomicrobiota bacterium]